MTGVWVEADTWLRHHEQEHERRSVLRPLRRELLTVTLPPPPPPKPTLTSPFAQRVLLWIEEEADRHRKHRTHERGGTYSGRRAALLGNRQLAVAVHRLCKEDGVGEVLAWLGMSRQSLRDVWLRHGLEAPGRVARPRGSRVGGMRS
jgi:hypothetical protein